MMKFLFFPNNCTPFHRYSLEEHSLGGTETGIISLSNALADLGHLVTVVSDIPDNTDANPRYITFQKLHELEDQDVCLAIRNWKNAFIPKNCKRYIFWTGDSFDNLHTYGIGDPRVYKFLDALFCVSDWQAKNLCALSGFPQWKSWVLRNGVCLAHFAGDECRHRKRLIYTSQPNRGMEFLPRIFKLLKERHPTLELHIFSSATNYHLPFPLSSFTHEYFQELFASLKKLQGCFIHGSTYQKHLAREFKKSAVWIYPTAFEETSCISAMEAQAAGCAVVTSALAGLNETVGDAGILLHEKPGSTEYFKKFIEVTDQVLSDDNLFEKLSKQSLEHAKSFDWKDRALSLVEYLQKSLNI